MGQKSTNISKKTASSARKVTLKKLNKECERLWSLVIRSKGYCEMCGRTETLQAAHILSRGAYPKFKYNLDNGLCLCYHCHMHIAHKQPHEFTKWFDEYKGPEYYDDLKAEYNGTLAKRDTYAEYENLFAKALRLGLVTEREYVWGTDI